MPCLAKTPINSHQPWHRYAVVANTGQHEGVEAPAVLLPSSLDGGAGGSQPLEGKTAGICWKVCCEILLLGT